MCVTRKFHLWLLQIIGLLGLLAICLWLSLRPKDPSFTVADFSMPTSTSHYNCSSCDEEGGSLYYVLDIKNPNKDSSVYYNDILLTFYHGQDMVGKNNISGFHQGKDKSKQVMDHVDAKGWVWKALVKAASNGTAELKVGLLTTLRYKTWGVKSKHHGVNLEGVVPIGSDGKISGKKKKVKLRQASKKWKLRATGFR